MDQIAKAVKQHSWFEVAYDVWGIKDVFVNVFFIRNSGDNSWVLVDAGLKTSYAKIKKVASELFGDIGPSAIILTHGHFDHVGSVSRLAEEWKVPVYAHYLELPYLMGKSPYPPPDPTAGGGMMALLAKVYPYKPVNIKSYLAVLPEDGVVPFLNEWKYIHTPGHSPGHISMFRESDRLLLAGDAIVTTTQESAIAIMTQKKKIARPSAYFTYDWDAAYDSIEKLVQLNPSKVATGHGKPMQGVKMHMELNDLYVNFYEKYVPSSGRYISEPAIADESGVIYVPVTNSKKLNWWAAGAVLAITAGVLTLLAFKTGKK